MRKTSGRLYRGMTCSSRRSEPDSMETPSLSSITDASWLDPAMIRPVPLRRPKSPSRGAMLEACSRLTKLLCSGPEAVSKMERARRAIVWELSMPSSNHLVCGWSLQIEGRQLRFCHDLLETMVSCLDRCQQMRAEAGLKPCDYEASFPEVFHWLNLTELRRLVIESSCQVNDDT